MKLLCTKHLEKLNSYYYNTVFQNIKKRSEVSLPETRTKTEYYGYVRSDTAPRGNRLSKTRSPEFCAAGFMFQLCCIYCPSTFPSFDYEATIGPNMEKEKQISAGLEVPYNPAVNTGLDYSPRTIQSDMFEPRG